MGYNIDHLQSNDELLDDLDGWRETFNNPHASIETEQRASDRIQEITAELRKRGVEVED